MAEALAGFAVGYAFALLFTAVASVMLIEARQEVRFLSRAIAPNISSLQMAVPVSLLAFLWWTMIGLVLGMLYRAARVNMDAGGLGSPNWPYTLAVALAAAAALAAVWYGWQRLPLRVALLGVAFATGFGWGVPHLASLG